MPKIWTSRSWRDEAEAWIRVEVARAGHELTGPIEQVRVRPWSTQLTVSTSGGLLWFKENHPAQAAEAAVIEQLARLTPDHVVAPVAVERSRGWLLSPDHGQTMLSLGASDEATWSRVVVEFAELQRRVAEDKDVLLTAGLAPLLPEMVADHVEQQVERLRSLPPTDVAHIAPELARRVVDAVPAVRETAERLAAITPGLASLDHNDLHQNNVFAPRPEESRLRFFDFGDALWAHPFTTLAVPVGMLCEDWQTDPSDPRVVRILDAYLEVWPDVGSLADRREALRLARVLHPVHRLESWRRLLEGGDRREMRDEAEIVSSWLGRVADIDPGRR